MIDMDTRQRLRQDLEHLDARLAGLMQVADGFDCAMQARRASPEGIYQGIAAWVDAVHMDLARMRARID